MPGSLGLSHQVMNSLHQPCAAKVSSEEEREREEDGTSRSQPSSSRCSGLKAAVRERRVAPVPAQGGWQRTEKSGLQLQF